MRLKRLWRAVRDSNPRAGSQPAHKLSRLGRYDRFGNRPYGGQDWNRTRNLLITSELHCQLCYLAINKAVYIALFVPVTNALLFAVSAFILYIYYIKNFYKSQKKCDKRNFIFTLRTLSCLATHYLPGPIATVLPIKIPLFLPHFSTCKAYLQNSPKSSYPGYELLVRSA